MNELEKLEQEERELLAQLELKKAARLELMRQQEETRKAEELKQPVTITFVALRGNYVHLKNEPFREDVLEVVRNIEGRIWKSYDKENAIPIGQVEAIITALQLLPSLTITYLDGVKEQIHEELYAPDFQCHKAVKQFELKVNRRASSYELRRIPGHNYDYHRCIHTIPLSEGWRLYEFSKLPLTGSFVWTDEAKEFVLKQVENRLRLDEIAKATDVELVIPELKATMKNFQKIGVKFFELNGGRGILADEMGTGKTLQMIALALHMKWRLLIVCPAALKENWLRELRKFAPQLTTYTCQGEAPIAYDIAKMISSKPDVIIINYDIIGRGVTQKIERIDDKGYKHERTIDRHPWVEVLNLTSVDAIILDEGHYIKNTDSQRSKGVRLLDAPYAISLTGTPILNRPQELWAMLNVADKTTFPMYETFKNQYTYDGKTVRNVEELKQLLKPLMIRRLKKDVIKELDPINRINSYYELSEKGRKLYDKVLAGVFEVLAEWSPTNAGAQQKVTNMLVQIQRLKQVVAIDGVGGTADLATEIYDSSPEATDSNKVLIFSQFKATTYAIARRLGHECLSFVHMTDKKEFVTQDNIGQQKLIDQFQSDPSMHFLCVTEKTAKEGHNITAAKAVIFNDLFWTPAGHQQAEARAYGRISDLHTIDSYYRVGVNSISEYIMELLAAKLRLIEQVVDGVEASRVDVSIVHELLSKLKEDMWTIKKK